MSTITSAKYGEAFSIRTDGRGYAEREHTNVATNDPARAKLIQRLEDEKEARLLDAELLDVWEVPGLLKDQAC